MFTDWRGWLVIVVLAITGYVQDVGRHFEHASGLKRLENVKTYQFLFRGAVWPFFRWGGFIRIACVGVILFLFGWRQAVICGVAAIAFSIALRRVTKGHAITMMEQVTGLDKATGNLSGRSAGETGGSNSTDDETASKMQHQHVANAVLSAANEAVAGHCDQSMKMLEIAPTHRAMFECMYYALVLSVLEVALHEKYSEQAAEDIMNRVVQRFIAAGRDDWFEVAFQKARSRYVEIGLVSASNAPFTDESSLSWAKVFTSELAEVYQIPCSEWKAGLWAAATIGSVDNASRQL